MGNINFYEVVKKPKVMGVVDIYTVMEDIKSPSPELIKVIQLARKAKSIGHEELYDKYKLSLPCFTFNFLFKDVKKNENIISPTGLIYIDHDDNIDIDLSNEYIFASWLSVSGKGRVILVRVEGLSLDNFSATYSQISELLSINTDKYAAKATQYNIYSYDPDLYHNDDSLVYKAIDMESKSMSETDKEYWDESLMNLVQFSNIKEIKDKVITKTNRTSNIRHNNIDEYDFEGRDYILFEDEKELIAELYIPRKKILKGGRNLHISTITHQLIALNPEMELEQIILIIRSVNSKFCEPMLSKNELQYIINTKWDKKFKGELQPFKNKARRMLLNPKLNISAKEKRILTAQVLGDFKTRRSYRNFCKCFEEHQIDNLKGDNLRIMKDCTGAKKTTLYKYMKMVS